MICTVWMWTRPKVVLPPSPRNNTRACGRHMTAALCKHCRRFRFSCDRGNYRSGEYKQTPRIDVEPWLILTTPWSAKQRGSHSSHMLRRPTRGPNRKSRVLLRTCLRSSHFTFDIIFAQNTACARELKRLRCFLILLHQLLCVNTIDLFQTLTKTTTQAEIKHQKYSVALAKI